MIRVAPLMLLCGCFVLGAPYVGPPADSKPESCPVQQVHLTPSEGRADTEWRICRERAVAQ